MGMCLFLKVVVFTFRQREQYFLAKIYSTVSVDEYSKFAYRSKDGQRGYIEKLCAIRWNVE